MARILCAIGWAINAQATSLNGYYLGMIIAGIGAGVGDEEHLLEELVEADPLLRGDGGELRRAAPLLGLEALLAGEVALHAVEFRARRVGVVGELRGTRLEVHDLLEGALQKSFRFFVAQGRSVASAAARYRPVPACLFFDRART